MVRYSAICARIMRLSLAALFAPSLMVMGSPVLAQDAAPETDPAAIAAPAFESTQSSSPDEIVVTGKLRHQSRSEIHQQARDISVVGNVYHTPIARMEARLCPGIVGLRTNDAVQMIDRIRYQGEQLGLPIASDGCRANMNVVFTDNGQKLLTTMYEKRAHLFSNITVDERRILLADTGPVHVWSQVETRGRDGQLIAPSEGLLNPPTVSMWGAHSKIYKATREDITLVTIVIDLEAAAGKTLSQLADYAVMRGFVRTRPSPDMSMDSILGLFENDGPHPLELTDFDQAYLNAIYDGMPNIPAAAKIGGVNRELRKIARADDAE